jgi:4-amino-4-deoxy-L-arabinose transferase-like glycosyltransferase
MNTLERATRRANLALLLSGLASLITWCAVMLFIWTHTFTGPDLRNEFSMFLSPVFAIGVALTVWGGLQLRPARKGTQ